MIKKFLPDHPQSANSQSNEASISIQVQSTSLTLDATWLRSFPHCAHYTDKRAEQITAALSAFATLLIESSFFVQQPEASESGKMAKHTTSTHIVPFKPKNKKAA